MQVVLRAGDGHVVRELAQKFTLKDDEAESGITSMIAAVAEGVQSTIASDNGCLVSVLASGQHARYADDLTNPAALVDGDLLTITVRGQRGRRRGCPSSLTYLAKATNIRLRSR